MALSPNRRFLAVCERYRDNMSAFISFYDMKTFKSEKNHISVCEALPTTQKEIIHIAFSADSKFIAILLHGPETRAVVYEWYNKNKSQLIG